MAVRIGKISKAKGLMPALQWAPLDLLDLDHSYQRAADNPASLRLIKNIARDWDWNLCLPLIAARRPGVVEFFVVDGQHRLAAARLRNKMMENPDISQLPCVIVAYDGAEAEAAAFVALNEQRRPLSPLEIYRAALTAGETEALAIDKLVKAAGLSIALHGATGQMKPGEICNIPGIRRAMRRWGEGATGQALQIMAEAWRGQRMRFAGTLFPGIVGTIGRRIEGEQEKVVSALFTMILAETSQEEWRAAIAQHKVTDINASGDKAATAVLMEAYAEAAD